MFNSLKITEASLREAGDIISYFYDLDFRSITLYDERVHMIKRCLFYKFNNNTPDNLSEYFHDASIYFAKVLAMKFEDHYRLKRSNQLDFDRLIEAIFRRGRTDAEIRLLMVKYFKEPIGSLGYPLKKVL